MPLGGRQGGATLFWLLWALLASRNWSFGTSISIQTMPTERIARQIGVAVFSFWAQLIITELPTLNGTPVADILLRVHPRGLTRCVLTSFVKKPQVV